MEKKSPKKPKKDQTTGSNLDQLLQLVPPEHRPLAEIVLQQASKYEERLTTIEQTQAKLITEWNTYIQAVQNTQSPTERPTHKANAQVTQPPPTNPAVGGSIPLPSQQQQGGGTQDSGIGKVIVDGITKIAMGSGESQYPQWLQEHMKNSLALTLEEKRSSINLASVMARYWERKMLKELGE